MKSNRLYKIVSAHSPFTQEHRIGWIGELVSVESGCAKLQLIDGGHVHAGVNDLMKLDEKDIDNNVSRTADKRMLHKERGY